MTLEIIEVPCIDCGELRKGQSGIKEPRCGKCFTTYANKFQKEQTKVKEEVKKKEMEMVHG